MKTILKNDVIHIWLNTSVSDYYLNNFSCFWIVSAVRRGVLWPTLESNSFQNLLIFMSTFIVTHRHCIVLHTCRWFPLHSRGERAIAEACETISPLPRFHISIVSIDQDLPQSFALPVNMNEVMLHCQRNEGGTFCYTRTQEILWLFLNIYQKSKKSP